MLLQEAAARCAAAEAGEARALADLEQHRQESQGLRNQDLTVRRLEEKVRSLEKQLEEKVSRLLFQGMPLLMQTESSFVSLPLGLTPFPQLNLSRFPSRYACIKCNLVQDLLREGRSRGEKAPGDIK